MIHTLTSRKNVLRSTTLVVLLGSCGLAHAAQNPVVVGQARFSVLTPNCIRIEYAGDSKFIDTPSLFAANRKARFDNFKLEKSGNSTIIDTGAVRLSYSPNGQPLSPSNLSATIKNGNTNGIRWTPGMPNRGNLGGTTRTLDGISGPVNLGQGVVSRDGWYLLDDSKAPLLVGDWVAARPQTAGNDWYLFGYGTNYRAALKSLTAVGGDIPLPRKNTLGTYYSRYWAYSSDDFRNIVQEYKQHDFPLDNMVLDMDWHRDGWTGWSWNRKLIPDPAKLMSDLHAEGLQVTLNLHPADGVGPQEDGYASFMKTLGQPADGKTLPFDAGSQKYMGALSKDILEPLHKDGVDFWWLDWQQYPNTRSVPEVTNLWWLNELLFRDTSRDGRRGISLSRWAGWGDHRHPIHFSGDADSGWRMLAFEVPYTSTAGNVGCFFWSHDIGGHQGGRNEESYTRWSQFGALSAALRPHSTRDVSTDRRPWTYPKWAENSMRASFHLRSELFPYIYTSVAQSTRDSVPLTRPMYIDYPTQEASYHNAQQYMYGDNLLVAPIVMPGVGPQRVAHQAVWFPADSDWYNVMSGEKYQGDSRALCTADINEMPLFARGGVPLPMQPYSPRMTTAPLSTLRLRVYPGAEGQTGRSSLYEDDGNSNGYKTGASATTPLSYTRRGNQVQITVGATTGKYSGQLAQRAVQIELAGTQRATTAMLDGNALPVTYNQATATNTITVPARAINRATTVTVTVADANFDKLRQVAAARRMSGLVGREIAPQPLRDLAKNALSAPLTNAERTEALAIVGVGIIPLNQSPMMAPGDIRDVVFAPENVVDGEAQVETVSRSRASFAIGGQKLNIPEIFGADDIASQATVTVSGLEPGYGFAGATDQVVAGYPSNRDAEWSADKKEGATIRLTWKTPQKVNRIALYDRPNANDNVLRSQLTFSDGTTIEVGPLPNEGDLPAEVRFGAKTIEWVEWKALEMTPSSEHAGLSEFAVFRAP